MCYTWVYLCASIHDYEMQKSVLLHFGFNPTLEKQKKCIASKPIFLWVNIKNILQVLVLGIQGKILFCFAADVLDSCATCLFRTKKQNMKHCMCTHTPSVKGNSRAHESLCVQIPSGTENCECFI